MRTRLIALGMIILFIVGFIFLRGPIPHISIASETLVKAGDVPVLGTSINITNTILTTWVVVVLVLISILFITRRKWTLVPGGVQNFVEAVVEAFYNLVTGIAGEEKGRRFFPVVATIFFFVLISNWLSLTPIFNVIGFQSDPQETGYVMTKTTVGPFHVAYVPLSSLSTLSADSISESDSNATAHHDTAVADGKFVGELIPLLRGPNTDLNTPLAIAIWSAIFVEFWGISSLGLFRYGKKFFNFGQLFRAIFTFKPGLLMDGIIDAFVGGLEFISECVRVVSFTFRLFGNMFAGEVVILMFTFLTPLILTLPFYGLELFVGVVQAFIFASLTLVFAVMATQSHDGHEAHDPKHPEEFANGIHEAIAEPI
jgi:F-type H+-transporting ATPase subunit a